MADERLAICFRGKLTGSRSWQHVLEAARGYGQRERENRAKEMMQAPWATTSTHSLAYLSRARKARSKSARRSRDVVVGRRHALSPHPGGCAALAFRHQWQPDSGALLIHTHCWRARRRRSHLLTTYTDDQSHGSERQPDRLPRFGRALPRMVFLSAGVAAGIRRQDRGGGASAFRRRTTLALFGAAGRQPGRRRDRGSAGTENSARKRRLRLSIVGRWQRRRTAGRWYAGRLGEYLFVGVACHRPGCDHGSNRGGSTAAQSALARSARRIHAG